MIEYHGHVAILAAVQKAIATAFPDNATRAGAAKALAEAMDEDRSASELGACLDAILDHASSDGHELQLLGRAADIWTRGLAAYDDLAVARKEIEQATQSPSAPDAVQVLKSGVNRLVALQTTVQQIEVEFQALHTAITPLRHIVAHPRQQDWPAEDWSWRDAFLGRRTEALVAALFEGAVSARSRAFAGGALAGYAGNAAGSAYLGAVVGGPRRAHRFRDRLARNALGAWFKAEPGAPSSADLGRRLNYIHADGTVAFPADLATQLRDALALAYPSRTAPDLDLGLTRTVRHLRLLDGFRRPTPPQPPATFFITDATASMVGSVGEPGTPPTGVAYGPDPAPNKPGSAHSEKSSGASCLAVIIGMVVVALTFGIYCIVRKADKKECNFEEYVKEIADGTEWIINVSQSELTALSMPDAAAHIVKELFALQMIVWQAFDLARGYLAVTGLIYPDDLQIGSPLYQQFLSTPARSNWPHRAELDPAATYHDDPKSPFELPVGAPVYPAHHSPAVLLAPWPSDYFQGAAAIAIPCLERLLGSGDKGENVDLDADRGFGHLCWKVRAKTSINDPTLSVDILPYDAE